jgi:hypothetical protein
MKRSIFPALALLMGILASAGCAGGSHVEARPELEKEHRYHTLAILPPQVSIDKLKMTGGESMVGEALTMEDTVLSLLTSRLAAKGYEVKPSLGLDKLNQDPELKRAVSDLQSRHDDLLSVMVKDIDGVSEGRFKLGGDVLAVGAASEAELLIFVRANGMVVSGGKKTFVGILSLGQSVPRNYLVMIITVVDARDGQVMATVEGAAVGSILKNPQEVVGKALDDAFRKFPAAKVSPPSQAPQNVTRSETPGR